MSSTIFCASPHNDDPMTNNVIPNKKTGFRPMLSASFPYKGVETAVIKRKIDTTQFIISNPSRSETIVGIAVETIVPSIAVIKVVIKIASVTIGTFVFFIYSYSCLFLLIIFDVIKQSLSFIGLFPW